MSVIEGQLVDSIGECCESPEEKESIFYHLAWLALAHPCSRNQAMEFLWRLREKQESEAMVVLQFQTNPVTGVEFLGYIEKSREMEKKAMEYKAKALAQVKQRSSGDNETVNIDARLERVSEGQAWPEPGNDTVEPASGRDDRTDSGVD